MMKQETLSRRAVLRGAVALGCSAVAPIILSGCDSNKGTSTSGPAPAPAPVPDTSASPAAPATTQKMSQASVQYQAQPKGEQKCSGCLHFIADSNTCKLVEGQISPEGWCSLWAKRS